MKKLNEEELIIRLIKDCLINTKLISGLNSLGLLADDYTLGTSDTIFKLMGFEASKQSDFIYEKVFKKQIDLIVRMDFARDDLTTLSEEIYSDLLFVKGLCEIKDE